MEQKIEKVYLDYQRIQKKGLAGFVGTVILLTAVASIFLGPPIPHKEEVLFFTVRDKGWLLEKPYLFILILASAAIFVVAWEIYVILKELNSIRNLLYKECDAQALLEFARAGMDYEPKSICKNSKKAERMRRGMEAYFERFYVEALNGCGRAGEALEYLENKWRSRHRRIYRLLEQNTRLILAFEDGDTEKYVQIYEEALPQIKNSLSIKAQKKYMEKQYEEGIGVLKQKKSTFLYEEVLAKYMLGRCCYELGDYEEAGEYLMFVIEHGGTTAVREKAARLSQKLAAMLVTPICPVLRE